MADHDDDFEHFHQARQQGLVVFVGELAGGGREQEERQDEQAGGEVNGQVDLVLAQAGDAEADQDDQRVLEHVVVERAQGLGPEERAEAAGAEQVLAGCFAHAQSRPGDGAASHEVPCICRSPLGQLWVALQSLPRRRPGATMLKSKASG